MKKVYKVVATFVSKSKPGTYYTVKMDEEGILSCNCPTWVFKRWGIRDCPHIRIVKTEVLPKVLPKVLPNAHYIIDKLGRRRLIRGKKKKNPIPHSVATVNSVLRKLGFKERLAKGKDYYYWHSGDAERFAESGVYVYRIQQMTVENWVRDLMRRKAALKNPEGLYDAFHGSPPMRIRKVRYESPNPKEPLIKIGRLSQINYIPEYPSKRKGVEFYHRAGDLGYATIRSNAILATNKAGTQLYILKEKGTKYPRFTKKGLIG